VGRFASTRLVDGVTVHPSTFKAHSGYVTQEDTFHPTQTVAEAVMFQAHLRYTVHMHHGWGGRCGLFS
jgi:ABC-type multidrug transport system ATPase subunit